MQTARTLAGDPQQIAIQLKEQLGDAYTHDSAWMELVLNTPTPKVGPTPKEPIWRKNKSTLYHYYIGDSKPTHALPILIIYALINRPYILDLYQNNSVVEFLIKNGYDVYLLDWGEFGWEDKDLGIEDLVFDYIRPAVKQVLRYSKAKELSLFGYCMGGALEAIYLAAHPEAPVRNALFLATPIDFDNAGIWTKWLDPNNYNTNKLVETMGIIPPEFIRFGSMLLKPVENFVGYYTRLRDNIENQIYVEYWLALNQWISDGVALPGKFFGEWLKDLYQENKLVKKGLYFRGKKIDLANIKANTLVVAGELDHICLIHQSKAIMDHISSKDKDFVVLPLGHLGFPFGYGAHSMFYPLIKEWFGKRSD